MVLDILVAPDPRLKIKARPVEIFDVDLQKTVTDLLETLSYVDGVGLAATQVGINQRIIVVDADEENHGVGKAEAYINPEIIHISEGKKLSREGCFSVPDFYEEVSRAEKVTVRYQDPQGQFCEKTATGLLGVCLQHEIDHLNGVLFIDYLSRLKRDRILTKLKKHKT